jgi:hypothetical protein
MIHNFLVILFKNKIKKRIIKKFITYDKAKQFFNKLKEESEKVIFEKNFENGQECNFELGLIEKDKKNHSPIYLVDEMGRNIKVKLEDDTLGLVEIIKYKKEEKLFDLQKKVKITFEQFEKKYLVGQTTKMISSLNNKIIVQEDDKIYLFSLKNDNDCERFLSCISNYFFKTKKTNCIVVKSWSTAQKKYLFKILAENGIDKKILYRKFTTYPHSK